MTHTLNRIETHWPLVKNFIKSEWPKISETELDSINGNVDKFLLYLKESYGGFPLEEAKARAKLQKFTNTLDDKLFTSTSFK